MLPRPVIRWLASRSDPGVPGDGLTIALSAAPPEPDTSREQAEIEQTPQRLASRNEILPPEIAPSPRLNLTRAVADASRWSGSAWVFLRSGADAHSPATSGQLGGSQATARLRWRLNSDPQLRTAIYGRVTTALADAEESEAAIGAEWHPLPNTPLWIAAERRIAIGKHGRNAWSAYAAGGIWRPGLPLGLTLDGYGQAGIVGARSRDMFADGAIRLSHPVSAPQGVRVGAGVWAAAQPYATRLDVGPNASVPLKLARQPVTLSADLRMRVAGNARPGSGVAVTLGSDF